MWNTLESSGEEPVVNTDFEGYATIHAKTKISLAMGEREYSTVALRELIGRRALDLWQPDLIRLGGVEAWRDSAALANAYNIPVLPHYYKDYDVPLLCTVANHTAQRASTGSMRSSIIRW